MADYRKVRMGKKQKAGGGLRISSLVTAVLLFLAVCFGERIHPQQLKTAWERVIRGLDSCVDFSAVFQELGASITGEKGALEGLEQFCVEVFGPQREQAPATESKTAVFKPVYPAVRSSLLTRELEKCSLVSDGEEAGSEPVMEDIPAVGTVIMAVSTEKEYPDSYTADELSFGRLETVSPVLGYLNSGFGYRDHPVNGKFSFHSGTDISANEGDDIISFADGVVEYVGEDSTYGLYLQIDHGNEIKSFYAHCHRVCVEKGQRVSKGERIAVVGSSGRATGPHLHLELKCRGMRVDPAHYIDFL